MKRIIVIALTVIMTSCAQEITIEQGPKSVQPEVITTIVAFDGNGSKKICLYVIDSCEYIGFINAHNTDVLTHKGNCRFCKQRNTK